LSSFAVGALLEEVKHIIYNKRVQTAVKAFDGFKIVHGKEN
jgi:hypothetical protein